jgi:U3 small nucleolar RNA-associated protein 13
LEATTIEYKLLRTLKPHASPVVTAAINRIGTLLATGGADGIVKVWDIRGGYVTHTFHGHSGLVSALHFFEVDQSTALAEEKKGKKRKKGDSTGEMITDQATFGCRLASGGEDGTVRIWNLHSRSVVAVLDSHVSVVRTLDYSPEETALLSGSRDKTVMIWDARNWKNRSTIPILEEVETAGFLKQGSLLYTGGENSRMRIWSVAGRELTKAQASGTETEAIQDSIHFTTLPFILTVHADQTLILHGTADLDRLDESKLISPLPILRRICGTHGQVIDLAYVGEDKSLLALATNLENIRIISLKSNPDVGEDAIVGGNYFGADVAELKGHDDIIICMDVDWSGHWLATGAKDNTARLWRLDPRNNSYTCYAVLTGHAESIGAVSLPRSIPPSNTPAFQTPLEYPPPFLVTGSQDKTVKRWDIPKATRDGGKKAAPRATYTRKAHDKDINSISIHHSSQLFASASQDKTVKIWSVEDGSTIGVLRGHRRGVWAVSFSPPGSQLNIAGASGSSSSRGYALTGSGDKTVRIWSLADYSCLVTMEGHTNSVLKTLWLPIVPQDQRSAHDKRGPLVVSGAGDGLVKIWDVQTGECAATLDNHTDRVWALAIRPGSKSSSTKDNAESLVSGAGDGVITFWEDTTSSTAEEARSRETQRIETDQQLANLVYSKNYREAIVLALQLDQPARLLSLFKSVVESDSFDRESWTGSVEVDEVVASLADEQIYRLLLRCRDWNTNARNSLVAQRVLRAIVGSFGMEKLASMKVGRIEKGASLPDVLRGLRAYGERHFGRVADLCDESFLLEFTLREMDELAAHDVGTEEGRDGFANGMDVIMVE